MYSYSYPQIMKVSLNIHTALAIMSKEHIRLRYIALVHAAFNICYNLISKKFLDL